MVHNSAEHVMRNLASCKCNEETNNLLVQPT